MDAGKGLVQAVRGSVRCCRGLAKAGQGWNGSIRVVEEGVFLERGGEG